MTGIQIDIWGGDLHCQLVESQTVATWPEAFKLIEDRVEAGLLVNVLHTDFKEADPEKVNEAMREVLRAAG